MLKTRLHFIFLFLITESCTHAQTFNKAKLDSFFSAINVHNQNMGSIAIAANGTVVYQKAIGYRQVTDGLKRIATTETKYRIGSISKMFTATMIFQLIDEGKLNLEAPLADYFPQLPNARKITIREMLNHHSGLHNFTSDSLYTAYMAFPKTEAEMVAIFSKQKPDFEPDMKAEYSNTNFVLLGYIIEKITGRTYAEELKRRITSKIGLNDTYYGTKADPAKNEAYSYNYAGQWLQLSETDMSIPGGAGAIVSTPTDLVKFINALFEGKLITANSLELMKTMKDNYGMAMFAIPFYNEKGYGHSGGIDAFSSLLVYFPQKKLAIAYLSNGTRYSTYEVLMGALSIYFNKSFTIPAFKNIVLNAADLNKYVGRYYCPQINLKVSITQHNSTLFAQATGQGAFPLEVKDDNTFAYAGINLKFVPAKNAFTLTQRGAAYTFRKTN